MKLCDVSATFTTSVAMTALVLILVNYPDVQAKLQAEIDWHVGNARLPEVEDHCNMPLMEAAILETLRYISHVPLSLPHMTLADTAIGGYDIPKHTEV